MTSRNRIYKMITGIVLSFVLAVSGTVPAVYAEGQDGSSQKGSTAPDTLTVRKGTTFNEMTSASAAEDDRQQDEAAEVVVMFKDDTEITETTAKKALSSGNGAVKDINIEEVWNFSGAGKREGLRTQSDEETEEESGAGIALVTSDTMDADQLAAKLEKRPDVKYAEKNFRVHALSISNDAYSDFQWSMQSGENAPNVDAVWKGGSGTTGSDKVVAIVDTGINYRHPDLVGNMWVNSAKNRQKGLKGKYGYDFINGDDDPMDDNGHGTHCAGIIGASGNNEIGISGVNQQVKLMALKMLDYEGSAYLAHEIAAYNYISKAIDLGVPVAAVNNSWGGGEESDIFAELINIVGAKGAVTVCAAGNEALNNDDYPGYPCDIDSPYIISVGATREDGNLASFSNYGDSVDIAAPGADILSTVSYDSYNPTIYGAGGEGSEQNRLSEKYNDFESEDNTDLVPDAFYKDNAPMEKDGDTYTGKEGQTITVEREDEGFLNESGHAIRIKYTGLKEGDFICAPVSYTINEEFDVEKNIYPRLSIMVKTKGPEGAMSMFGGPIFGIIDAGADDPLTVNGIGNNELVGGYVDGDGDTWHHYEKMSCTDVGELPGPGEERRFVLIMYASESGDYEVLVDDMGMSSQKLEDTGDFGQYDFYSGTSMATPYITGAVALLRADKEAAGDKVDTEDLINEILSMAKDETAPELPIAPGRSFDFRSKPSVLPPRILKVSADFSTSRDPGRVVVTGSGFDPSNGDLSVRITKDDVEEEVTGISGNLKEISFDDKGWINNIIDIAITTNGKTARKNNIYLISGKDSYTKIKDATPMINNEAVATNGRYIYNSAYSMKGITRSDPRDLSEGADIFAEINTDEVFDTIEKDPKKQYGMLFGNDLIYANGYLYTMVEYGAADEREVEDDDWFIFSDRNKTKDIIDFEDDEEDDEEEELEDFSIYDGEYRLVRVSTSTGRVDSLGAPDPLVADREGYTMAAYNGKIYFIGGYTVSEVAGEDDRIPSKSVTIYDPDKDKWSEGPELPEGRYGGKAIQTGSYLVYTLGSGDESAGGPEMGEYPSNLVFDGQSWKVSDAGKLSVIGSDYIPDVSVVKGGILYTGLPVFDYGDTFIYDVAEDRFRDTGYNFIKNLNTVEPRAVAVGGTVYASSDDGVFKMPVESGFVTVKAKVKGKGKVTGAGNVAPGNDANLTVKANKHNHIKSIKVNGKAVKVKSGAVKQTVTIKRPSKDQTVAVVFARDKKVKVTVKKSGKGKVTGAKKYYVGSKVKITVKAAKKYYIKSFKVGAKTVKLKKKAAKASYTIKKIKKNTKVVVKFAKK